MQILALIFVGSYALLNLFLAAAGTFYYPPALGVGLSRRLIPAAVFVVAALTLGISLWLRNHWIVAAGLLLGSIAPILYGALIEQENVVLHHLVRAAVAVGIMVVWLIAFPVSQ
ncbi:MAG: hypothetical protein Q4G35_01770 [Propionibacteriaceae bacterium]|nr:hypothetical protein [Propionibacteriaceae bacterium]